MSKSVSGYAQPTSPFLSNVKYVEVYAPGLKVAVLYNPNNFYRMSGDLVIDDYSIAVYGKDVRRGLDCSLYWPTS
jgi:hypothetical protein